MESMKWYVVGFHDALEVWVKRTDNVFSHTLMSPSSEYVTFPTKEAAVEHAIEITLRITPVEGWELRVMSEVEFQERKKAQEIKEAGLR